MRVPLTGTPARRVLQGGITISTGEVLLLITDSWHEQTPQYFLQMIRAHWRGWHLVLCEDRGSPPTAEDSRELAKDLHREIRLLPVATPELKAMAPLWRNVKGRALADRATRTIDLSADLACQHILHMSPQHRWQKAGVLSGDFWLTN